MHTLRTTASLWRYLNNWPDTKVLAFTPHWVNVGQSIYDWAPSRAVSKLASLGVLVLDCNGEWFSYRPIPMNNRGFKRRVTARTGKLLDKIHIEDFRLPECTMLCAKRRMLTSRTYECGFHAAFICHKCVKIAMRDRN